VLAVAGLLFLLGGGPAGAAPCVTRAVATGAVLATAPGAWTVYHGGPAGAGAAAGVASVDTSARVWTSPTLDGKLYGEPLAYRGRVYVATENDTVYALSAATGTVDWSAHVGSPVPAGSLPCGDISPTVGITGTPVIDSARGEVFAVADTLRGGRPAHVLVGLSTATGKVELRRDVDPPGADPATLLQRTGLTLDAGQVVFGLGGNDGDCGSYRGRVVAVPEAGGPPRFFTVDAAAGQREGAIWMGGAAPVVDGRGNIWVTSGNGSVTSPGQAYDDSDAVLELSASLRLRQFFAPREWAAQNASDLDMSVAPALLPGGQVLAAGKAGIAYLLDGSRLDGIGGQQATLGPVCDTGIEGGAAVLGSTAFLPCLNGIAAVRATAAPPGLRLLWKSGAGGGPPVIAAGLVWTMSGSGVLYGLAPSTGKVVRRVTLGALANHFPTPSVAGGLLLAGCAITVVAFRAQAVGASGNSGAGGTAPARAGHATGTACAAGPSAGQRTTRWAAWAAVLGGLAVVLGGSAAVVLARRRRHRAST
jgi:polyvinyl alcohol dehydrogenase (cytochrome)